MLELPKCKTTYPIRHSAPWHAEAGSTLRDVAGERLRCRDRRTQGSMGLTR